MTDHVENSEYLIDDPDYGDNFEYSPPVSICIPTLNDGETLERSLTSLRNQTYDDLEIIVIDGYSDDGTIEIAEQYADQVLFDENNYGSACRKGISTSDAEIVGLFDGDIYFPHKNWLSNAVSKFAVSDNISTVWPQNTAPDESSLLTKLYFEHWNLIIEDRIKSLRGFYGGGNSLFRRKHLVEVGSIDESIHWGADFDWAKKLHQAGYQVVYHRDPICHDTMRSFSQFYNKQFSGAKTFSNSGFGLMGLTFFDVLREQYGLGLLGMVSGLILNRQPCWLLYPPYMLLRTLAYSRTYIKEMVRK